MSTGSELIAAERQRQLSEEGYDTAHDVDHVDGELLSAAMAYAKSALCVYAPSNPQAAPNTQEPPIYPYWPWHPDYFKAEPFTEGVPGAVRSLVKAGALIAAEIDRLSALEQTT